MNELDTEARLERLCMMRFNAFTRRITNTWISPVKSRPYYEDFRRVFFKDESPEGFYPACVVPENLLGEVVVITPLWQFQTLLEAWKRCNKNWVESARNIVVKEISEDE